MKKSVLVCTVLFLAIAAGGIAATQQTAPAVRVGTAMDAEIQKQVVQELHARLAARQIELGVANSIVADLNAEQRQSLYSDESQFPLMVGLVAPVNANVSFDSMPRAAVTKRATIQRYGAIRSFGDTMVWSTSVESFGATGIRLYITGLDLPAGAELAIYNERGEAFAYTGRGPSETGEFWTNTVTGHTAFLQLSGADITDVDFKIADLGYLGDRWVVGAHSSTLKAFCSYNADCVENANCEPNDPAVSDARKGVAHMQYVKRPYVYVCSGGLLSNDAGKPYFLTANHCISRDREAGTLEAYFLYEVPCGGTCPDAFSYAGDPRTLGSSVVSTNSTADYTLLELSQPAPAGTVMLLWDPNEIAFTDSADLYRISHPASAPQAYSTHRVDTSAGTCSSWPRGSWIYSRDVIGATEGGSSGSPVINAAGLVVGQLSGACGTNLGDNCDAVNNATVDGAFASYYGEISSYLGGGCTPVPEDCDDGIDNDCDGLIDGDDPDCGGCISEPEICDDGIDNDCDGFIDSADPDCEIPACFPRGTPCTSNDECCSGSCHHRKFTCK